MGRYKKKTLNKWPVRVEYFITDTDFFSRGIINKIEINLILLWIRYVLSFYFIYKIVTCVNRLKKKKETGKTFCFEKKNTFIKIITIRVKKKTPNYFPITIFLFREALLLKFVIKKNIYLYLYFFFSSYQCRTSTWVFCLLYLVIQRPKK